MKMREKLSEKASTLVKFLLHGLPSPNLPLATMKKANRIIQILMKRPTSPVQDMET